MKYLLDTHILLWARLDPAKLKPAQRRILLDTSAQKLISSLSIWEISLKFSLGKLSLGDHSPEEFFESMLQLGFQLAEPSPGQFASFYRLPKVLAHKDPFDRMLIWQALQEKLTLLTSDQRLPEYKLHGLLLA
ncbi:MAG TPA: type II toxin-antitoxin system VapC family toxin [Candidatus Dormibacteraeota bacterium]|nr:type II toxin-antitoxin system VapC family toxin [Candidatus Dormibacteraeota bacterium]